MIRVAAGILIGMVCLGVAYAQGSSIVSGLYMSSPPTYTSGQFAPVHVNANGAVQTAGVANSGVDIGDVTLTAGSASIGSVASVTAETGFVITSTITRIADHAAYTAGDFVSDSTTAPTSGGFTFTGACRAAAGTGVITDIIITDTDDAAVLLTPTLRIYNTAVTNGNDNSAFAVTDAEAQTMVAKVIGTILIDEGAQDALALTGLNINYNCVGSANLRWLLQTSNAYDPAANSGVIQVMIKGRWTS